jgi:hypothetical protein
MNEAALQSKIIKKFGLMGIYCRKMRSMSADGFPDLLAIYGGKTVYMECKHPNGRGSLEDSQVEEIALMREHGATVYDDVDSLEKAYAIARNEFDRGAERRDRSPVQRRRDPTDRGFGVW